MTSALAHHAAVLVGCVMIYQRFGRARWAWAAPRIAVGLWQLLLVATLLAAVGVPLQLARWPVLLEPVRLAMLALGGGIAVAVVAAAVVGHTRARRLRRRHIQALTLVAERHPAADGAVVIDYPGAAAYCVPGTPVIVISAGTLDVLSRRQVAAVIDHEKAHLRERHDLVLLPFATLARLLRGSRRMRRPYDSVALLVEMCADDRAAQRHGRAVVHDALRRLAKATPVVPAATMGAGTGIAARLQRLSSPYRPLPTAVRTLVLAAGAVVALTPPGVLMWPV